MKIFLAGGGTGGHLFPAISVAEELEKQGIKTQIITDQRCVKYLSQDLKDKAIIFDLGSMSGKWYTKILTMLKILRATISSIALVYKEKPSSIIAFGGYPTIPILIAAKIMRVKIILHEQNCFMGKVNRLFAKYADLIALNFEATANIPSHMLNKTRVVGNPVRAEIKNYKFHRNFDNSNFTILITGGSQGAIVFDELAPSAIAILHKTVNKPLKIIQQAAKKNHQRIAQQYSDLGIEFEINDFFHDIYKKYAEADLIICRAGASTIAELIYTKLPSMLIPLPTASCNHQMHNAKAMAECGAAFYFAQKDLTPEILAAQLGLIITDLEQLKSMSQNLALMRLDAAKVLVDQLMRMAQ
jgi:UDP-N-acetylglucosamine--N-acetylmuramyl-(pentapeptide) pyrophosphoryl-undecaprenol N-acetylglucosamine transferase